jgi:hypothetical protein
MATRQLKSIVPTAQAFALRQAKELYKNQGQDMNNVPLDQRQAVTRQLVNSGKGVGLPVNIMQAQGMQAAPPQAQGWMQSNPQVNMPSNQSGLSPSDSAVQKALQERAQMKTGNLFANTAGAMVNLPDQMSTIPGFSDLTLNQAKQYSGQEDQGRSSYMNDLLSYGRQQETQRKQQEEEKNKVFEVNGQLVQKQADGSYKAVYGDQKGNTDIQYYTDDQGNVTSVIFDKQTGRPLSQSEVSGIGKKTPDTITYKEDPFTGELIPLVTRSTSGGGGGSAGGLPNPSMSPTSSSSSYGSGPYVNLDLDSAMRLWSGGGYGSEIMPEMSGKTIGQMSDSEIADLVQKMATREGFYAKGSTNRPQRNNNPGNIKVPAAGIQEARKRYGDPNVSIDPVPAADGGFFLKFSSPEIGFNATKILLKLGQGSGQQQSQQPQSPSTQTPSTPGVPTGELRSRADIQNMTNRAAANLEKKQVQVINNGALNLVNQGKYAEAYNFVIEQLESSVAAKEQTTEKSPYWNARFSVEAYENVLDIIGNNKNTIAGPYKKLFESAKPYALISKDPAYVDILQWIQQAEAPIKNRIYGAALTPTEEQQAKYFLLNDKDTMATIQQKVKNNLAYQKFVKNIVVATKSGIPENMQPRLKDFIGKLGGGASNTSQVPGYDKTKDLFSNLPR